jgi:hypothetical protein
MTKYRDWVSGITHTMVRADSHIGSWGDLAWFTTSGTEVDDFYSDELGNRRDVSSVKDPVTQGLEVLWFGRKTKNDWLSWVEFIPVNTSGPDRLACLHSYHVLDGDSGGPVYINGQAVGLVWGWVLINGARRDCFSQARYVNLALGVTIKR